MSTDPNVKGPSPLLTLDPTLKTNVVIANLAFEDNGTPVLVEAFQADADDAAAAYMMNYDASVKGSYYFVLPGAVPFNAPGLGDTRQVPQSLFVDGDNAHYEFIFQVISWTLPDPRVVIGWLDMPSPVPDPSGDYPVYFNHLLYGDAYPGEVFELGVATNIRAIPTQPEPEE